MDFDFSDLVGPFSALAAFVSAAIAYQANWNVAKSDRVRQVREVSLLANKVVAATIHIDDLSNELKMGYQTLFTFAGQGGGGSRLKLYVDEVEKKQTAIGPMQQAARSVLDNDPQKLSDEQITDSLLEFEGNLAHLGTQACIRAGYAKSGAHVQATRLLRNAKVVAAIDADRKRLEEKCGTPGPRLADLPCNVSEPTNSHPR